MHCLSSTGVTCFPCRHEELNPVSSLFEPHGGPSVPALLIRESQRCSTKFAESLRVSLIRFNEALPPRHEVVQATWPKPSTSPD